MEKLGEIRRQARDAIGAARPSAWLVTLACLLLTEGLMMGLSFFMDDPWSQIIPMLQQGLAPQLALPLALRRVGSVALFFQILALLFTTVIRYGYRSWALKTARGVGQMQNLADGFGIVWRVILLRSLMALYAGMWSMVFSIPVMILSAYARSGAAAFLIAAAGICACAVYLMRYQMAPYCLMDDERHRVLHSLHQSAVLLRGRTWEFIRLLLSFLGWIAIPTAIAVAAQSGLLILTRGWDSLWSGDVPAWIGMASGLCAWPAAAWVTPYLAVSIGLYYDRLRPAERPDESAA